MLTHKKKGEDSGTLDGKVTLIKKDSVLDPGLTVSKAILEEDAFATMYWNGATGSILQPPYDMDRLATLVEENNILSTCISAYEVNIDGSGYKIENEQAEVELEDEDPAAQPIIDFFNEVTPRKSFLTLRRELRRHLETTGNGYLEVVRNAAGELIFLNTVAPSTMRLMKLGNPITVTQKIKRFGKDMDVVLNVRCRVFAQQVGTSVIYFKEYGVPLQVNRNTGALETTVEPQLRGGEIIHLTVNKAANSPYGVPRWITQTPSVIGSRKAEELNLEFFNAGGLPPVIVFISGGSLQKQVRNQLENIFSATAAKKSRGAVVEVQPTGGSLDKENKPDVKVEQFNKTEDSMFENYDEKCERRVRSAFRLPPIFVGKTDDYNFASAYASYMVAEAQVFKPERDEFDEIINMTIMRELDPTQKYQFKSKGVAIKDVANQLKALGMLKGVKGVDMEGWVDDLNEVSDLSINYDQAKADEATAAELEAKRSPFQQLPPGAPPAPGTKQLPPAQKQKQLPPPDDKKKTMAPQTPGVKKAEMTTMDDLLLLADQFCLMNRLVKSNNPRAWGPEEVLAVNSKIKALKADDRQMFDALISARLNPGEGHDLEGTRELCGCAINCVG